MSHDRPDHEKQERALVIGQSISLEAGVMQQLTCGDPPWPQLRIAAEVLGAHVVILNKRGFLSIRSDGFDLEVVLDADGIKISTILHYGEAVDAMAGDMVGLPDDGLITIRADHAWEIVVNNGEHERVQVADFRNSQQ